MERSFDGRISGSARAPTGISSRPKLYKENGFKEEKDAKELIRILEKNQPLQADCWSAWKRNEETKNPPLLYNLAELQNECSKMFEDQSG